MGKGKGMVGKYYTRKDGTNISTDKIDRRYKTAIGHQHDTSSTNFTSYEHPKFDRWIITLKNGNTDTITASSYEAAVRIRDHMDSADKRKKPRRDTSV